MSDSSSGCKRKRKVIALDQKAAIIRAVAAGTKKTQVAKDFGIAPSTLSTILGRKEAITGAVARGVQGSRKKLRSPAFEAVEEALFKWFLDARASNLPVSGALLQRKAIDFACILGCDNFVASDGWLQRFKERRGIVGRVVTGESRSVDEETATAWVQANVGPVVRKYGEQNVFNADETALFYQMLPQRTLSLKGELCRGGKHSKVRVSVLLCTNMDGSEKIPPLVIGKSTSPRCFKGKRRLQLQYLANRKAWMTRDVFAGWLRDWDEKLKRQNRKICLFLDNCSAHHTGVALENIELRFLPPNCTAVIQPIDQGVIMSLKAGYRKRVIDRLLLNMRLKRDTKIDLYMAMEMLHAAWMSVTASTIANCFRRAFAASESSSDSDESADRVGAPDDTSASNEAVASWSALIDSGVVRGGETFCDYVSMDSDVVATEELADSDYVLGAARPQEGSDDECVEDADSPPCADDVPTSSQALDAVDLLRRYFGGHEDGEDGLDIADAAERAVLRLRKMNQRSITDFFTPST